LVCGKRLDNALLAKQSLAPHNIIKGENMKAQSIPEGCHAITPYLTVPNAARLIEF
jgi:hypothetical protein